MRTKTCVCVCVNDTIVCVNDTIVGCKCMARYIQYNDHNIVTGSLPCIFGCISFIMPYKRYQISNRGNTLL